MDEWHPSLLRLLKYNTGGLASWLNMWSTAPTLKTCVRRICFYNSRRGGLQSINKALNLRPDSDLTRVAMIIYWLSYFHDWCVQFISYCCVNGVVYSTIVQLILHSRDTSELICESHTEFNSNNNRMQIKPVIIFLLFDFTFKDATWMQHERRL